MNLALVLAFSIFALAAKTPRQIVASTPCTYHGKSFEMRIETEGTDVSAGEIVQIGGAQAEKGRAGKDGYVFVAPKEKSLCEKTQAYGVGGKFAAVLFEKVTAGGPPLLHIAFYDPARDSVRVERRDGVLKDLVETKDGFAFSTGEPRSEPAKFSRLSPWGKEMAGVEDDLRALRRVRLDNGKVSISFDPDLSYEHSPWKAFYKTKEDYLNDAGWNKKTHKFKNLIVYSATYANPAETKEEHKSIGMAKKSGAEVEKGNWRYLRVTN